MPRHRPLAKPLRMDTNTMGRVEGRGRGAASLGRGLRRNILWNGVEVNLKMNLVQSTQKCGEGDMIWSTTLTGLCIQKLWQAGASPMPLRMNVSEEPNLFVPFEDCDIISSQIHLKKWKHLDGFVTTCQAVKVRGACCPHPISLHEKLSVPWRQRSQTLTTF